MNKKIKFITSVLLLCIAMQGVVYALPSDNIVNLVKEKTTIEKKSIDLKTFIATYSIQDKFVTEINRLIEEGYQLCNIQIVYSFLNDKYGKMSSLEQLLKSHKEELSWSKIFQEYTKNNPEFTPRTFDFKKLHQLMSSSLITTDDIMIADRISFVTEEDFFTILMRKVEGESFKTINEEYEILNSQETLLKIQITNEQIAYYIKKYSINQDQVIEAFVLANKFNVKPLEVIKMICNGDNQEKIYANILQKLYN